MRLLLRLELTITAFGPSVLTAGTCRSRGRCRLPVTSRCNARLGPPSPAARRITPTATSTGQSRRRPRPYRGSSV